MTEDPKKSHLEEEVDDLFMGIPDDSEKGEEVNKEKKEEEEE